MKTLLLTTIILLFLLGVNTLIAQDKALKSNYVGFMPAILAEPYDTIDAIEVNLFPFVYERRMGARNELSLQIRPIANYRFFKAQSGFSQMGGTLAINKYFLEVFAGDFWLKPQLSVYYTYAYNRLDQFATMTSGFEPGVYMIISNKLSLSVILQPGINYYPDENIHEYVDTESGFKGHFGILGHFGYNF